MIGVIITGHGHFATGLTSSVELIGGPQENYFAVDFDGNGTEQLETGLRNAFESLKEADGILVFTDLAGGSPFKTAAILSQGNPKVAILAGTNLPMLVELTMARNFNDDLDSLVETALRVGQEGVIKFEMPKVNNGPADDEDGI